MAARGRSSGAGSSSEVPWDDSKALESWAVQQAALEHLRDPATAASVLGALERQLLQDGDDEAWAARAAEELLHGYASTKLNIYLPKAS